jgi:hypothetical protein
MESRRFGDDGFSVRVGLFAFRDGFPIQFIEGTCVCFQSVIHYGNKFGMNLILMDLQCLPLKICLFAHIPAWFDRILLPRDLNCRGDDESIRGCMVLMRL